MFTGVSIHFYLVFRAEGLPGKKKKKKKRGAEIKSKQMKKSFKIQKQQKVRRMWKYKNIIFHSRNKQNNKIFYQYHEIHLSFPQKYSVSPSLKALRFSSVRDKILGQQTMLFMYPASGAHQYQMLEEEFKKSNIQLASSDLQTSSNKGSYHVYTALDRPPFPSFIYSLDLSIHSILG